MKINIFTDTHLNVSRQAHTTAASSARLNEALYQAALAAKSDEYQNFHLGDLFDKSFNPEWAIAQGIEVARDCVVVAGNHDETNRADTKCSLEVVEMAGAGQVARQTDMGQAVVKVFYEQVFVVPHHATQELFEDALSLAKRAAMDVNKPILMVHCNRGNKDLHIDAEMEHSLLEVFARVFYGHEHNSTGREDVRAVVVGNTHPTSFSDITDKYTYTYCLETDELQAHLIWDKSKHYKQLQLNDPIPSNDALQFIEVVGQGNRHEAMTYLNAIWEQNPQAYMVRSNVEYIDDSLLQVTAVEGPTNIVDVIKQDLDGTDMQELFVKLTKEI